MVFFFSILAWLDSSQQGMWQTVRERVIFNPDLTCHLCALTRFPIFGNYVDFITISTCGRCICPDFRTWLAHVNSLILPEACQDSEKSKNEVVGKSWTWTSLRAWRHRVLRNLDREWYHVMAPSLWGVVLSHRPLFGFSPSAWEALFFEKRCVAQRAHLATARCSDAVTYTRSKPSTPGMTPYVSTNHTYMREARGPMRVDSLPKRATSTVGSCQRDAVNRRRRERGGTWAPESARARARARLRHRDAYFTSRKPSARSHT